MFPKDIVVFLEKTPGYSRRLAFAGMLAERWQAHLIATFVVRRLELDPHADFAAGAALTHMLAEYEADVEQNLAQASGEFERVVGQRSFTSEWRVSRYESGEALMLHARHASLAILGPPSRQADATTMLGLAENMIFASGRPCLLLPEDWPSERFLRRIVVGWNGGREATRAIADAMPLLRSAESVHVIVIPDTRVQELYGQDPGVDIAMHLARNGVAVELEQCPGNDAGRILLDRCAALGADLLVMGAMGRPRISEFVFGGATRTILDTARMPLLLSR